MAKGRAASVSAIKMQADSLTPNLEVGQTDAFNQTGGLPLANADEPQVEFPSISDSRHSSGII